MKECEKKDEWRKKGERKILEEGKNRAGKWKKEERSIRNKQGRKMKESEKKDEWWKKWERKILEEGKNPTGKRKKER